MRPDPAGTRWALAALSAAAAAAITGHAAGRIAPPAAASAPTAQPASPSAADPALTSAFWKHWSDGKAEMNGYRLVQPRYGQKRPGTAVLIFVTEDFSDSARVKADPGQHPPTDVYPVLKLNAVRDFQTGIYDYNVMTSVFARVAVGWPLAKVSFSSQEWCGHVYHQLLPRGARVLGTSHSYFDGEADASEDLELPAEGVFEDALPIVLREWMGAYLPAGQSRTVPFLPSLLRARLDHRRLAWGRATLTRGGETSRVTVPAGTFEVANWAVSPEGAPPSLYQLEAAAPYRLVRWTSEAGEEAVLLGSERLAYWKLNGPGGEKHLARLGLRPVAAEGALSRVLE
jgi:hypothetical protein